MRHFFSPDNQRPKGIFMSWKLVLWTLESFTYFHPRPPELQVCALFVFSLLELQSPPFSLIIKACPALRHCPGCSPRQKWFFPEQFHGPFSYCFIFNSEMPAFHWGLLFYPLMIDWLQKWPWFFPPPLTMFLAIWPCKLPLWWQRLDIFYS